MSERSGSRKNVARPKESGRVKRLASAGLGAVFRFARRKPVAVVASVAIVGGAGIFAWNATMHQTSRHPAPLFTSPKTAAKAEPVKRTDATSPQTTGNIPTPPIRASAGPDAIGSIIRTAEAPARVNDKVAEGRKSADAKPRNAEPKPQAEKKPEDAKRRADIKPASEPKVASAQKALAKLGYGPIASDGILGNGTRQALEKFERDRKLPVTGVLGPRTAKQLASLSGISVE